MYFVRNQIKHWKYYLQLLYNRAEHFLPKVNVTICVFDIQSVLK